MPIVASRFAPLVLLLALVAGCGSSSVPGTTQGGDGPRSAQPDRTLNIAIEAEPTSIAAIYPGIAGRSTTFQVRSFNAFLDLIDARGEAHPYLAEALPTFGTDSWQVFPDGRMQTTYRLRPNLSWHDGTPFSTEDFVFTWRTMSVPEAGFGLFKDAPPFRQMDDITAPDPRTLVIRWSEPFPGANVLQSGGSRMGLVPFPRHILQGIVQEANFEALTNHPYWTRGFIGLGPYKLDRWELGTFMEAVPFDGHTLGRAKISRLRYQFFDEPQAILAAVRAGAIDIAADALTFPLGLELKREWSTSGAGQILIAYTSQRSVIFQFRPELVNPRALLDVRVRRALAHSVDRATLGEALWANEVRMIETIFAPTLSYYDQIDRAIVKYPFDVRASERLMNDAGFTKGSDGFYASPTDGRFSPEVKGGDDLSEHPILAAGWRQAGFDMREAILAGAQAQDPMVRHTFPSIHTQASGAAETNWMALLTSSQVGTAENRWRGSNRGGWTNPNFDRLVETFNATLDPDVRIRQRAEIARFLSEEVPVIMLSQNPNVTAHISALRGPTTGIVGTTGLSAWNIHEWELS
jgi:peptide/nickel transport system substrate-binding protein